MLPQLPRASRHRPFSLLFCVGIFAVMTLPTQMLFLRTDGIISTINSNDKAGYKEGSLSSSEYLTKELSTHGTEDSTSISTSWLQIWNRKGDSATGTSSASSIVQPLHHISGFTQMTLAQHRILVETILSSSPDGDIISNFKAGDKILEFGCGSGAFLSTLNSLTSHQQLDIYGVDYSSALVSVATARLPHGHFWTHDIRSNVADVVGAAAVFDVTISFGVFFYLDKLHDVLLALREMVHVTKKGGRVIICDLSDKAKQEVDAHIRLKSPYYQSEEYKKHAGETPPHLFIPKSLFRENAEQLGLRIDAIVDEDTLDLASFYEPAVLRYSVFATKL